MGTCMSAPDDNTVTKIELYSETTNDSTCKQVNKSHIDFVRKGEKI
jgi:hypothetical protein